MQLEMPEIYESFTDALTSTVKALGGFKKVGPLLRPELPIDSAAQWLRDCLNADRRERLNPDQVLLLMREAKHAGFHALMEYVAFDTGYKASPVDPQTQDAELQQRFIDAVDALTAIQSQMHRVQRLRAAG